MHPWEQQPDEKDSDYELFTAFRDAEPYQTPSALALQWGLRPGTVQTIAVSEHWAPRRASWRAHLDHLSRETQITTTAEMARRHAQLWAEMREYALTELLRMRSEGVSLSPRDLARIAELATSQERLGAGMATSRVELAPTSTAEARAQALVTGRAIDALPPGSARDAARTAWAADLVASGIVALPGASSCDVSVETLDPGEDGD